MRHPRETPHIRLFALLFLAAMGYHAAAAQDVVEVRAEARPAAVTVYVDQATVTRSARVALPAGDSVVIVSGIPTGVVQDSVSAKGKSDAAVTIGSVEIRRDSWDPAAANKRRAELEARIREVDDLIQIEATRTEALEAKRDLVARMSGAVTAIKGPPLTTDDHRPYLTDDPAAWAGAWDAIHRGTLEAADGLRLVQIARRGLEERKADLMAQLSASGQRPAGTLAFAISVTAPREARLDLSVTYQVPGASWRPVYEARLDSGAGKITLRQDAVVIQSTGEDWANVGLTLSTSRPSSGVQPPLLETWRVGLADPAPPMAAAPAPIVASGSMMRGLSADALKAQSTEMGKLSEITANVNQEATIAAAGVNAAGLAVEYAVPGVATVRSDGTERHVHIGDAAMDAALSVRAVPRIDPRGYLFARTANNGKVPLLAGVVSLYLDGVFVGRAPLPLARPEETMRLPFGPDDRVRVTWERQETRRATDRSFLGGKRTVRSSEGLMTVRNFHDASMLVSLLDQAPVTEDADLKIEVTADPAPTERDVGDKPGVMAWSWTLAKGEEKRVKFGYTLNAPEGKIVTGFPR